MPEGLTWVIWVDMVSYFEGPYHLCWALHRAEVPALQKDTVYSATKWHEA